MQLDVTLPTLPSVVDVDLDGLFHLYSGLPHLKATLCHIKDLSSNNGLRFGAMSCCDTTYNLHSAPSVSQHHSWLMQLEISLHQNHVVRDQSLGQADIEIYLRLQLSADLKGKGWYDCSFLSETKSIIDMILSFDAKRCNYLYRRTWVQSKPDISRAKVCNLERKKTYPHKRPIRQTSDELG